MYNERLGANLELADGFFQKICIDDCSNMLEVVLRVHNSFHMLRSICVFLYAHGEVINLLRRFQMYHIIVGKYNISRLYIYIDYG